MSLCPLSGKRECSDLEKHCKEHTEAEVGTGLWDLDRKISHFWIRGAGKPLKQSVEAKNKRTAQWISGLCAVRNTLPTVQGYKLNVHKIRSITAASDAFNIFLDVCDFSISHLRSRA